MTDRTSLTNPSAFREWLLERTGNHAKDIGEANRFADEIEQLRGNLSLAEDGLAAAMQENQGLQAMLLWIASMADEDNEWDGVERFRAARQKAIDAVGPATEPEGGK